MWIKVVATDNTPHLINEDNIIEVSYDENEDLSIITFLRSAYGSVCIKGNIIPELTKVLAAKNPVVTIVRKEKDD